MAMAHGHYTHLQFNGQVNLSYSIADVHGASKQTSHSITIKPVNDAPESKPISFKLETDDLDSATVSLAQLLSGSFDVDGDQLSIKNVQTSNGTATSENNDGSWSINTNGESGVYKLVFDVTDGDLSTRGEATVTVKHKPIYTTFEFLTTKIEAEED